MRLEQTVTVQLSAPDIQELRHGKILKVACACGQEIGLAWDKQHRRLDSALSSLLRRDAQKAESTEAVAVPKKDTGNGNGKTTTAETFPCDWPGAHCKMVFSTKAGRAMHIMRVHKHLGPQVGDKGQSNLPIVKGFKYGDKVKYVGRNKDRLNKVAEVRGMRDKRGLRLLYTDGTVGSALPKAVVRLGQEARA